MLKSRGWLALFGTHTASFLSLFLFVASTPIPLCLSLSLSLSLSLYLSSVAKSERLRGHKCKAGLRI
jgi:hypothetical protein